LDPRQLEGYVNAPEFPKGLEWLNVPRPLSMSELRGKLVLLDFWTFCCINCMHIIPDLKKLEAKYPRELVVIGVHSAKFTHEQESEAIRQAILRYEIGHPVVNDRDFHVWGEYGARGWPTLVLVNPAGRIIGAMSGEGAYALFDSILGQAVAYFGEKGILDRRPIEWLAPEHARVPDSPLSFPGKIVCDTATRRLFISDTNHNRIVVADEKGKVLDVVGSGESGRRDGPFEECQFNHPQGVAFSGDRLFVADTENHLVRIIDLENRRTETLLGTGEQAREFNVEGGGTKVAINSPWDLLVRGKELYIAMAGFHQIWICDLESLRARPFAGSGREALLDGPLGQAALAQPSGLASDGGRLFFVDSETSSVRQADLGLEGRVDTLIGEDLFEFGDQDGDADRARLQHPLGVFWRKDILYVADTYNSKIRIVDPVLKTSVTLAGTGQPGWRDGSLKSAQFNEPGGLSGMDDLLFVADTNNHVIRLVDPSAGRVKTLEFSNPACLRQGLGLKPKVYALPAAVIRPGAGSLRLELRLPQGYKWMKEAPSHLEARSMNEKAAALGASSLKWPVLEWPVEAAPGSAMVIVEGDAYFCAQDSSRCLIENVRIELPIVVKDGATAKIVQAVPLALP